MKIRPIYYQIGLIFTIMAIRDRGNEREREREREREHEHDPEIRLDLFFPPIDNRRDIIDLFQVTEESQYCMTRMA